MSWADIYPTSIIPFNLKASFHTQSQQPNPPSGLFLAHWGAPTTARLDLRPVRPDSPAIAMSSDTSVSQGSSPGLWSPGWRGRVGWEGLGYWIWGRGGYRYAQVTSHHHTHSRRDFQHNIAQLLLCIIILNLGYKVGCGSQLGGMQHGHCLNNIENNSINNLTASVCFCGKWNSKKLGHFENITIVKK